MDSFEWVDRISSDVGRVLVTPENGSTPYYAVITRADNPEVVGTPIDAEHLNALVQKSGGTMTGTLIADETTRTTRSVFNIETHQGSVAGPLEAVKYFIAVTD